MNGVCLSLLFGGIKDKDWRVRFFSFSSNHHSVYFQVFFVFTVSEIIGLQRALSVPLVAGNYLIRPHRKCAFHLLFPQIASVRLVSDTSFLAENT